MAIYSLFPQVEKLPKNDVGLLGKMNPPSLLPAAATSPAGHDLAINIQSGIKNPKENFSLSLSREHQLPKQNTLLLSFLLCMYMLLLQSILMIDQLYISLLALTPFCLFSSASSWQWLWIILLTLKEKKMVLSDFINGLWGWGKLGGMFLCSRY